MKDTEVLYFGCLLRTGHFLHRKDTALDPNLFDSIPWNYHIDGKLLERAKIPDYPDGSVLLVRKEGYSALCFWDRSVDSRPGSNSAFIVRGELEPDEILRHARDQWPEVFARLGFPKITENVRAVMVSEERSS